MSNPDRGEIAAWLQAIDGWSRAVGFNPAPWQLEALGAALRGAEVRPAEHCRRPGLGFAGFSVRFDESVPPGEVRILPPPARELLVDGFDGDRLMLRVSKPEADS